MESLEIKRLINTFLIEKLELEETIVKPEADLKKDLGMTSLDAVETARFIKQNFNIVPDFQDIKAIVTVQDIYDYIEKHQIE